MKKSINVFVAVFMVMSVVLTACQPAAGTVTTKEVVVTQLVEKVVEKVVVATDVPAAAVPVVPTEPQAGGSIRVWLPNSWPEQSHVHWNNWESGWAVSPMVDRWANVNADGSMDWRLAEGVEVSADGLTYTMAIRKANFHNGDPVTADDVIYTLETRYSPDLRPLGDFQIFGEIVGLIEYQAGTAKTIEGIKKVDDQHVSFTLKEVNAGFMKLGFAGIDRMFPPPMPKKVMETLDRAKLLDGTLDYWYTAPIGTGPYKFVKYETDQYIEFARNDDYWGGKVGPDSLFMVISSPDAALVALQKGELDLVTPLSLTEVSRLKADATIAIEEAKNNGSWWGLEFNRYATDGLWKNKAAMQAFYYSIDRPGYVKTVLQGNGAIRSSWFDGTAYACPTINNYEFDLAKADEMWIAAGYPKEKRATIEIDFMSWLGNKARLDSLPIWQSNMRKLGFMSNVDLIDNALIETYVDGEGPRGKEWDIHVLWTGPGADPGFIANGLLADSGNYYTRTWPFKPGADGKKPNAPLYDNKRVVELLGLGKLEMDPAKRTKIFQEIDCIWNDELPAITMAAASNMVGKSLKLQGLDWAGMAALGQPYVVYRAEKLWIWDGK